MLRSWRWLVPLSLLVGVMVNLAIAWRCLYWQQLPLQPEPGATAQQMWDRWMDYNPSHVGARFEQITGALGCDFIIVARDSRGPPWTGPPRMMITRAGLPFRAFEAMHSWGDASPSHAGGIRIDSIAKNVAWLSILPLRPMPLGFMINTLAFAGAFWFLMVAPAAAIRDLRRQRRLAMSHCANCGYDLQGLREARCPECGTPHQTGRMPRRGARQWLQAGAMVAAAVYLPHLWMLLSEGGELGGESALGLFLISPGAAPAIFLDGSAVHAVVFTVAILIIATWVGLRSRLFLVTTTGLLFIASACQSWAWFMLSR